MAGVYIHIPFCRQICRYCDFYRSGSLADKQAVLEAIGRELTARRAEVQEEVKTLYFGGGTPSLCSVEEIGRLVEQVCQLWDTDALREVTLEANPDDLTPQYLSGLRTAGVNRLSIGIQSFCDAHLERMHRRHTAQEAVAAVKASKEAGFDNLTIDLIYGLPWMTPQEWEYNLKQALALGVPHISAYHLTIEPGTVFGKQGLQPVKESVSELHFRMLREALCGAGYEHYEVSNFARPGFRALHNSNYWQGKPYLGAGPSAHSYDGFRHRRWNVSSNRAYLAGEAGGEEWLSDTDRLNEYLMTRLRTVEGLSLSTIASRFGAAQASRIGKRCAAQAAKGLLRPTVDGYAVPGERFLISDYVISELFDSPETPQRDN